VSDRRDMGILRHQALVAALDYLRPRFKPVRGQAPGREDQGVVVLGNGFELGPTLTERQLSEIPTLEVQAVERHEHRRGR
jgi:hypothetical protein